MKSLNQCMFIGNVGKEPEISYTASGVAVAKFSIACNESWKDKDGNPQEKTEWINVVAWKKLAEIIGQYVKKGMRVYVSGKFSTRSWDDKNDGKKRYAAEIVADNLIMLGDRGASSGEAHPAEVVNTTEPQDDGMPF